VRDEAHRFAIAHHRQRRGKAMTASVLDDVPGLGPARKKALIGAFGSLKRLRGADADSIAAVQGIGPTLASAVVAALAGAPPEPAVDTATGEIID
jgi:excinuclease ABC subunit C